MFVKKNEWTKKKKQFVIQQQITITTEILAPDMEREHSVPCLNKVEDAENISYLGQWWKSKTLERIIKSVEQG